MPTSNQFPLTRSVGTRSVGTRSVVVALVLISMGGLIGCKPSLLPGTQVEDTPENQAVLRFLERYRSAVESRSAEGVLKLVASDYWEDRGTVEQEDDYGIEKLERDLQTRFAHTRAIHLQLQLQHIAHQDGLVRVDYRYMQRALLSLNAGDKWVSHSDVNRLVLRPRADESDLGYEIVAGL